MSYPEHEKLKALGGDNDTVGDFIEWLGANGYVISEWGKPWEKESKCDADEHNGSKIMRKLRCPKCMPQSEWTEPNVAYYSENDVPYDDNGNIVVDGPGFEYPVRTYYDGDYMCKGCRDKTCAECRGTLKVYTTEYNEDILWPVGKSTEQLIGEHFGIDPKKLSEEKEEMYQALRAMQAT